MSSENACGTARGADVVSGTMEQRVVTLDQLAAIALEMARKSLGAQPRIVAISGIDGSGKTHIAAHIREQLESQGIRTAVINLDPWHTSRAERLAPQDSARVFYERAFRWSEFFTMLLDPLARLGSIDRTLEVRRLDDDSLFLKRYHFHDVTMVLVEGIFLFRREYLDRYDLRIWIDCSFETALARAYARNQEQLSRPDLEREYAEVYFAAQRLHFERDCPRRAADLIVPNDAGE
jgi:uridine kinase